MKRKLLSLLAASAVLMGGITTTTSATAAPVPIKMATSFNADTQTTTLSVEDEPVLDLNGEVVVKAMNNADQAGKAVGDIPLSGFQFQVSWYKGYYNSVAEAKAATPTMKAIWQTNANGFFSIAKDKPVSGTWNRTGDTNDLPLGTLLIEEVKSVPGVDVNDIVGLTHIKLNDSGVAVAEKVAGGSSKAVSADAKAKIPAASAKATVTGYDNDVEWKGGLTLTKFSEVFGTSENTGDSYLEGTQFDIINRSKASVWINGAEKKPGDVVVTIEVQNKGENGPFVATTGEKVLPYGTYEVVESKNTPGYLKNTDFSYTFSVRTDGQMEEIGVNEGVVNDTPEGNFYQGKADAEFNQYLASGGSSSLAGAVFSLTNSSDFDVKYGGKRIKPGQVMGNVRTYFDEERGQVVVRAPEKLDYGTYTIKEIQAPLGYIADPDWSRTFSIREDEVTLDFTSVTDSLQNQIKRLNLEFKKVDEESSSPMAGIAFKLTNVNTGEAHILVTDENGKFHTEMLDPTYKTNANDPTSPNSNGAIAVQDGEWVVADETKLDPEAGIWFTGADPAITEWVDAVTYKVKGIQADAINAEKAPLTFGVYELEELRQPANEGRHLFESGVRLDKTTIKDGYNLDLDNIENRKVNLYTDVAYVVGEDGVTYNIAPAAKNQTIVDEVMFDNFIEGETYTMKGELALFNKAGKFVKIIATQTRDYTNKFQTTAAGDSVQFKYEGLDLTGLEGHKIVAYQTVTHDGKILLEHKDPNDLAQTIGIPEIGTTAMGDIDRESNGYAETIRIPDTIHFDKLEAGKEYTAKGTLMDKETGKPFLDANGKEITAETKFVAEGEQIANVRDDSDGYVLSTGGGTLVSGEVTVIFEFKAPENLPGRSLVAFEKVYGDGIEFATHADIEDENQTVTFPKVETKASDPVDGNQEVPADKEVIVEDTVTLENLVVGNTYTVEGEVHLKSEDGKDGGVIAKAEPVEVTATDTTMEVVISAKVDTSELAGRDIVWFEKLSREGVLLGIHADITDEGQTIHIPKIGTKLATVDGLKEVQINTDWEKTDDGEMKVVKVEETSITLIDTVEYENLTVGQKYRVDGELHRVITEDGKKTDGGVIAEGNSEFTAEKESGTTDVEFTYEIKGIDDLTVVAFESLVSNPDSEKEQEVAKHEDINDEDQTVRFNDIHTSFNDTTTKSKQVLDDVDVELVDTVTYTNLIPGKSYQMCGTVMVKETGKALQEDGKDVRECTIFVADEANGTVDIVFTINPQSLKGESLVAFEDLSSEGVTIAVHHDIDDEEQTVHIQKMGTKLADVDGKKVIDITDKETITLTDTIAYENVLAGEEYTMKGWIVNKKDGSVVVEPVTKTFTAEETSGEVSIDFEVDVTTFANGDQVVAFEEMYDAGGNLIGSHKDIEDKDQTVTFEIKPETPKLALTGATVGLLALIGVFITAGGVGALVISRRNKGLAEN